MIRRPQHLAADRGLRSSVTRHILWFAVIAFALCIEWPLSAAETAIADTLFNPDGSVANGRIEITNRQFTTSEGKTVLRGKIDVQIVNGLVSFSLEANDTAQPAGTSYRVSYRMSDGRQWLETWLVPTPGGSACPASPCKVHQLRVTVPPTPAVQIKLTQIPQDGATEDQRIAWDDTLKQAEWRDAGAGGGLDCASELTISAGVIVIASNTCYRVDTEADAASDDLTSITCAQGRRFVLVPEDTTRTVVLTPATGILSNFSLNHIDDVFEAFCPAANTVREIARNNGGT